MMTALNDLVDFCHRAGWEDKGERGDTQLRVRINSTLQLLGDIRNWPHYEKVGRLALTAPHTTGTLAVTLGSAAVVGTDTAFAAAMVGQELKGPDGRPYTIKTVTDATHLTLEENYVGADADGESVAVRYVRYATPDDFRSAGDFYHEDVGWVTSDTELATWIARRLSNPSTASGPSMVFCSPQYFYLDPAPSAARLMHYPYQKKPDDLDALDKATDWPEKLMWLLHSALEVAVRQRTVQDAVVALTSREFQGVIDSAWKYIRPSMVPHRMRERGRKTTWQDFQASFNLT